MAKDDGSYTPLSPVYPQQSTGRRSGAGEVDRQPRQPAHGPRRGQSRLALALRPAARPDVRNFGRNGKPPTHPELLDWLAAELMDGEWTMKHLHSRDRHERGLSDGFSVQGSGFRCEVLQA